MKIIKNKKTFESYNKKSHFISFAFNINNKKEAEEILNEISNIHNKAKHICYSYCVYEDNVLIEKYYESTEPSGSSGKQIYNLFKKLEIVNSLVVVVRYYGRTQLGLGLLTRTYLDAAKNVIDNNLIDYIKRYELTIYFNINKYQYVLNYTKENNIIIQEKEGTRFKLLVPEDLNIEPFLNNINTTNN